MIIVAFADILRTGASPVHWYKLTMIEQTFREAFSLPI